VFRRCISILVSAGLVANQLAVVLHAPHEHGAMSAEAQREHDATPHFHWRGNGERYHHHHAHRHHDGAHRHHDHVQRNHDHVKQRSTGSETAKSEQGHSLPEHDSDAVYAVMCCFVSATGEKNRLPAPWIPIAFASYASAQGNHWRHSVIPVLWHPPDIVLDGSHRYLTFRHLLI
jgi:hypothetical protein